MSVPTPTLSGNPWLRILDALEKKINRHSYDTWLKPTRYSHSSNGIMYVRVPTSEFRHVQDKYADLIQEALDNLNMDYQDVEFVTPDDDPASTPVRHDGGLSAARPGDATAPCFAGPLRLGRRSAIERPLYVRRVRDRQRQSVCSRRVPGGFAAAVESLQPTVPLRRCRHGQDPSDAGHRARSEAAATAGGHLLHLEREVHQRDDQLAAL